MYVYKFPNSFYRQSFFIFFIFFTFFFHSPIIRDFSSRFRISSSFFLNLLTSRICLRYVSHSSFFPIDSSVSFIFRRYVDATSYELTFVLEIKSSAMFFQISIATSGYLSFTAFLSGIEQFSDKPCIIACSFSFELGNQDNFFLTLSFSQGIDKSVDNIISFP